MTAGISLTEGWYTLSNSPKFHYMRDMKSLCKKWMLLRICQDNLTADNGIFQKGDCAGCRKALDKEVSTAKKEDNRE